MRARNLKPSLFKNELLATSDPIYAWVFEGLWCLSDREGRLEDRPRRIHLEVNAGRAYESTESSLAWLAENGFIVRYEHGGSRYIQVVKFEKHQNPHVREPASTIPAPGQHSASTVPAPVEHESGPALSSFLIPDSKIGQTASPFDRFWGVYPKKVKRKTSEEIWNRKRLSPRVDELIADVERRIRADERWLRGFIPDPTTYLNQERWADQFNATKEETPGLPVLNG